MIEAALIVVALVAVVFALARWRDDDEQPATLESGHSHMRSEKR